MRTRLFAVLLFAASLSSCATAWSAAPAAEPYRALVTGTQTEPPSSDEWVYTVTNASTNSDYVIWLLQIEVDERTDILHATSPEGWTANLDIPYLIVWVSISGDIPAGESLTGFGVTYASAPEYQSWTAMFNNISVPGDTPVDFGDVIVPEPGGVLAMLVGLGSLFAHILRRKRE